MSKDTTYNGWTNYETWLVNLWMDNEEGSQRYWATCAEEALRECRSTGNGSTGLTPEERATSDLSASLKSQHEEAAPQLEGFWSDLLNAALSEVNWYEIAGHLVAAAKEEQEAM